MPIYEYACHDCRKIYQFFSKTLKVEKAPACPKCGAKGLERVLSPFAAVSASKTKAAPSGDGEPRGQADAEGGAPGAEDDPFARMPPAQRAAAEREMMKLMDNAEGLDEGDPRQLGRFMERMTQITGMQDKAMEEAIRRLKAGEAPDKIEEDMGGALDQAFGGPEGPGGYGQDPGLYDM